MKMRTILILACLLSAPALAKDGNWLLEISRSHERVILATDYRQIETDDVANARMYMTYVQGVFDTHTVLAENDVLSRPFFCTPENATVGQVTAVVTKYLKTNPDKWSMSAPTIVMKALHDAFPCGK
jgi:hypothetical protein